MPSRSNPDDFDDDDLKSASRSSYSHKHLIQGDLQEAWAEIPRLESDMVEYAPVDFEAGMKMFPPLTVVLAAVCAFIFVMELHHGSLIAEDEIMDIGAVSRTAVLDGDYWRLTSAEFLHGSIDHLLGNVVMLYILGLGCEHALGIRRTFTCYIICTIGASLMSIAIADRPSVGASGAIFGLCGLLIGTLTRHRKSVEVRDYRIAVVLLVYAGYQIFLGVFSPFIDNGAHMGGFLTGAICGFCVRPKIIPPEPTGHYHLRGSIGAGLAAFWLAYTGIEFVPRILTGG